MTILRVRARRVLGLALPIALMLLAQTVMSLMTIAMVSHLGDAAVAGVGVASALEPPRAAWSAWERRLGHVIAARLPGRLRLSMKSLTPAAQIAIARAVQGRVE